MRKGKPKVRVHGTGRGAGWGVSLSLPPTHTHHHHHHFSDTRRRLERCLVVTPPVQDRKVLLAFRAGAEARNAA